MFLRHQKCHDCVEGFRLSLCLIQVETLFSSVRILFVVFTMSVHIIASSTSFLLMSSAICSNLKESKACVEFTTPMKQ